MHTKNTRGYSAIAPVIAIAVIIIGGVVYYNTRSNSSTDIAFDSENMMDDGSNMMTGENNTAMDNNEGADMMSDDDAMMESDDAVMPDDAMDGEMTQGDVSYAGTVIAGTSAPLVDFNHADYEKVIASDKLVVLYFYANWCPVCKQETSEALYPAFNELSSDGVVGFRVNYNDSETDGFEKDLAREFGVAYQHTKVFVKNGARVLKSPESWDKDRYLGEIAKAL